MSNELYSIIDALLKDRGPDVPRSLQIISGLVEEVLIARHEAIDVVVNGYITHCRKSKAE